jgi:hypothetical protein
MAEMVLTGKNEVLEENTCSNSTLFTTNWLAWDWTRVFAVRAVDSPSDVNFSEPLLLNV